MQLHSRLFRSLRFLVALPLVTGAAHAESSFRLDLEAGVAWQTRNTFAAPGDTGTKVDLDETAEAVASRVTLTWGFSEHWSLRLLAAPLRTETTFVSDAPVEFEGRVFPAGEAIRQRYRFDSYRVSFFRSFRPDGPWAFRIGATAKVRSASVELAAGDGAVTRDDLGVVPLLHAGARFDRGGRLAFDAELDGLAAPQGRAIDLALRLELRATETLRPFVAYRLLDGGADNDEVLTFATFHYALVGLGIRF